MNAQTPTSKRVPLRWRADFWRLGILLLMAVALRILVIGNTTVPSRDCIVFCRYALDLNDPPASAGGFFGVIKAAEHPPGYPMAILAVSKVVRPIMGEEVTVPAMAMSAQVASALAGILLMIPLYSLVRSILDRNTAFAAAGLFGVLPGFVEVTSDGLSDGLFWLTVNTALWFGTRALGSSNRRAAMAFGFGAGLMSGLGYLVRPEAATVALSIGLTLLGMVILLWRRRRRSAMATTGIQPRLFAGCALIVGWVLVTVPYMAVIGRITNKPTGVGILKRLCGEENDPTYFDRQGARPGVQLPLAIWWTADNAGKQSKSAWAIKSLWAEYWKASFYALPAFGLIGLFALRRRLTDPRLALLLVFVAVQVLLLWLLAVFIGYVSQRHTILIVMVTCIFAAASLPYLGTLAIQAWHTKAISGRATKIVAKFSSAARGEALVRWMQNRKPWQLSAAWAAILMLAALPRNFHSLHEERKGHKLAGLWLKENVSLDHQVVDPFGWAEWYSTRTLRAIPNPDVYKAGPDLYAVFTPNAKSPHSRLGTYEFARELAEDRKPVWQYPADVPFDQIDVAVFRHPPLKPPTAPPSPKK